MSFDRSRLGLKSTMNHQIERVIIAEEPFQVAGQNVFQRGSWPASWVQHPEVKGTDPAVMAYRREFSLEAETTVRLHVTADERYELFLDGQRIGRGSERGDRHCWFFETFDLTLPAGRHVLVARVYWLGAKGGSARAQISVYPAFLLAAEGVPMELLNTGSAAWEAKLLGGYSFEHSAIAWGASAKTVLRGADYDWGHELGEGKTGWRSVEIGDVAKSAARTSMGPQNWRLRPAMLPAMLEEPRQMGTARHVQSIALENTAGLPVRANEHRAEEAPGWNQLLAGTAPLTVPAHSKRRVIVDLEDYYCAYPVVVLSSGKGAMLRIHWAEALFEQLPQKPGEYSIPKGNRNEIEDKCFIGVGNTIFHDGERNRRYEPFWWEAGRYLEIVVSTAEEPLVIESLSHLETHYPYEFSAHYEVPSQELADLAPLATRVLEMCSHETYMDCPYYEQLMYVGDTRLEVLVTYMLTGDDRLPRKAILLYDESRAPSGLTQARYPCRMPQFIPPFSLYWVGMVYDFALWRNDPAFVRERMPGVRAVLEAFAQRVNGDGLLEALSGWNFVDWVPNWSMGMPAEADLGISGIINWHFVYTLRLAAELEEGFGEKEFAERYRRLADRVAAATRAMFWDDARGVYADDREHQHFSEHAQCFAILAGDRQTKLDAPDLSRATIYFTHYLFEAAYRTQRIDLLFKRLDLWSYLTRMGLKTTVELPEPSRSDCHAWGAHPVYHTFASLLGIRPEGFGFQSVRIEPQLGSMPWGRGTLPHPNGSISVSLECAEGCHRGVIHLPPGVSGTFVEASGVRALHPGENRL